MKNVDDKQSFNSNELFILEQDGFGTQLLNENEKIVNGRKIYYISDLHLEYKDNKGFEHITYEKYTDHVIKKMYSGDYFGDDPLIIAGDISDCIGHVEYFFMQLRMRREGKIVFILGNHELWASDKLDNRTLPSIIDQYRNICSKYQIILLQNEVIFFYDERTGNGELLPYAKIKQLSPSELLKISNEELKQYARKAKLIIFGGVGFSGVCKISNKDGNLYNAELGLYRDIISTLHEDIQESKKCELAYKKILEGLHEFQVIILTHSPFEHWTELNYNPNFIYLNGHTHHNYLNVNTECTIFADNQIGYSSDCYYLKWFNIDGTYDIFKDFQDGIHEISYNQYIDFNIGKNIKCKKKHDAKQLLLLIKSGFYMFLYYNKKHELLLLDGGNSKKLLFDIQYYSENLKFYGQGLKMIMDRYISALRYVSNVIIKLGGSGKIHGCIVDIDYYNHVYIDPSAGQIIPYYAIDINQRYVYKTIKDLIADKCPKLLQNYSNWENKNLCSFEKVLSEYELISAPTFKTDRNMYIVSKKIKTIQYLLFQNVIRDWDDTIFMNIENRIKNLPDNINKS